MASFQKLRIAINVGFQNSFFSTGVPQATYALAAGFQGIGHHVVLVRTTEKDWYDDCHELKTVFPIVPYTEFIVDASANPVDIFIDVEGSILVDKKKPYTKKLVTFLHRLPFISEMEQSLFGATTSLRNMNGVDALLTWSSYNAQDRQLYEVMYKKPVLSVPYNWFHRAVIAYSAEMKLPPWSASAPAQVQDQWTCHITETNHTMTSSAIIPMVIMSQVVKKGILPVKNCFVNNSTAIKDNEYFNKNIMEHCKVEGLTYHFVGRQRIADWRATPLSFVIAHNRFIKLKPALLDIVWSGIPVIHNSPWLRTIGCGLERFYYDDNDILGACAAVERMRADYNARAGFFAEGALEEVKKAVLKGVYYDEGILYKWGETLSQLIAVPVTPMIAEAAETPAAVLTAEQNNNAGISTMEGLVKSSKKPVRVGFSDMWDQFNPAYNFFTLLLENAAAGFGTPVDIIGVDVKDGSASGLDLLIFGPFGSVWKNYPAVPKVHYTGENTGPIDRMGSEGVFLNLGYKQVRGDDSGYVRLPLWMLEIDWFGADAERIRNPKPLPLKTVFSVDPSVLDEKKKFCSFVVTNPRNEMRNNSFHWLNSYKPVDSAGRLFNNVGDVIYAGLGGGGGELKKHEFLKDYRFCLTYENEMCEGYTTEKILHAKAAGCVPIYWGDPLVDRDFAKGGFINANGVRTREDLIDLVKSVEEDPERWRKMASVPALDDYTRDLVRRRFSHIAFLIYQRIGFAQTELERIPRFVGKTVDDEYSGGGSGSGSGSLHYITYASAAVLKNLKIYMLSVEALMLKHGSVRCTVFLAPDVDVETYQTYVKSNPKFQFVHLQHDSVHVAGFDDFWTPTHYAWKPYIMQRVNADPAYADTLCFYNDCGMAVLDIATAYLKVARESGLCFLEDGRQTNRMWCHAEFCRALSVSEAEADTRQIWAGAFAFVAGSAIATAVLDEAWILAQQRSVIVGEKWLGHADASGCYGHRHDQSIYSIVGRRKGAGFYPLDLVYNDHSMLHAQKQGCALYVHRGNFRLKAAIMEGIDEVRLINLERRTDRLEKFRAAHPEWHHRVCVEKAVDGRALTLTPALEALFKPNDFLWKKAIMGCALSHLKVWKRLAEDNTIGSMLVLEDDVLFKGDFLAGWPAAIRTVPADWDVLYLGGVLPPNKAMYEKMVEPVNAHWGRIKENQVFGQRVANRYFHFCNYSYVLRRSAAVKLLASIEARGGYHTSADHMICNAVDLFKHYVLRPAAAGCYQDDDPKYANSEFNNFNRVDGFDSDLWNNDERFSKEEIEKCSKNAKKLSIENALTSITVKDFISNDDVVIQPPVSDSLVIYTVGEHVCAEKDLMEYSWLTALIKGQSKPEHIGTALEHKHRNIVIKNIDKDHEPMVDTPIFLVQVPHIKTYSLLFDRYNAVGRTFKALHISDEFGADAVDWVDLSACIGVLRNYPREDLYGNEKVHIIPLGWAQSSGERDAPWQQTPSLPFREKIWSFYGTRWAGRDKLLEPLMKIQPHNCILFDKWKDPGQLGSIEYLGSMLNSTFVACPGGQNAETFRFYEALESGAIPLFVRCNRDANWWKFITRHINLMELTSWEHATGFVLYLMNNKDVMEKYRMSLLSGWAAMKAESRQKIAKFIE